MPVYSYITYVNARLALANRLDDAGEVFFTDAEIKLYLLESLRTFNALTAFWVTDYPFTVTSSSLPWLSLNVAGSPRLYTLHDTDLYQIILYHLIEPQLASGTWAGTPQYTVLDLTQSYIRRQNEILQYASANIQQLTPINLTPGTRTVSIPDTVLDIRRARYVPVTSPPSPQTLWRGDPLSFQSFTPSYRQTSGQNPRNYALSDRPPLTLDVDFAPPQAGILDLLGTVAGTPANLPAATPLSIPDDWAWVLKFGMLADLYNKQGEATDEPRAQYCLTRYTEGLKLMLECPWLLSAEFNNVPVGVDSVQERDTFNPRWETNVNPLPRQGAVVAGLDLVSVCPRPTGVTSLGVNLEVVESAPIPVLDTDYIQTPRDTLDGILDYAVHLATLKQGGAEFSATIPLFDSFRSVCMAYNKRISSLGLYDSILKSQGKRLEEADPRYV